MNNAKTKILLVEDDPNFGSVLKDYLTMNEYDVTLCRDGLQGLNRFKEESFDLCILDVMMPVKDGFTLAREIKDIDKNVPFIFLTAKTLKTDMLEGFKIGADDYITKPFDSEILIHKIKAILNRKSATLGQNIEQEEFTIGNYLFNTKLRFISLDGDIQQKLSPKETQLLLLFCLNINDVVKRSDALKKIWGEDNYFTGRSMDVFIAKLRKYLKDDPTVNIVNIHGDGYRLVVQKQPS